MNRLYQFRMDSYLHKGLRKKLVEEIRRKGIKNEDVLEAINRVPRHLFMDSSFVHFAYKDQAFPIAANQTISQPFTVAFQTQLLDVNKGHKVLEIGTGSGYQAAVLAELGVEVYTVEIIPELADRAAITLDAAGYSGVKQLNADGYFGWEEFAPFDAIIVTAAPDHLPQPLAKQLAEGGRLVIPIGPVGFVQTLWMFEKVDGELEATNLGGVTFVPLTGEH